MSYACYPIQTSPVHFLKPFHALHTVELTNPSTVLITISLYRQMKLFHANICSESWVALLVYFWLPKPLISYSSSNSVKIITCFLKSFLLELIYIVKTALERLLTYQLSADFPCSVQGFPTSQVPLYEHRTWGHQYPSSPPLRTPPLHHYTITTDSRCSNEDETRAKKVLS